MKADEEDICLNKHGGDVQSNAAFLKAKSNAQKDRERVLAFIEQCGEKGATLDEVSEAWDVPPNAISGRFSELRHRFNMIYDTGDRRPTRSGVAAKVYKAVDNNKQEVK